MYYSVKVNDNEVMCKDFVYHFNNCEENPFRLVGVWYGSEAYKFLVGLLDDFCTIELIVDGNVFARLDGVVIEDVEYHLLDEDVNFSGVFIDYSEDLSVLEDVLG